MALVYVPAKLQGVPIHIGRFLKLALKLEFGSFEKGLFILGAPYEHLKMFNLNHPVFVFTSANFLN